MKSKERCNEKMRGDQGEIYTCGLLLSHQGDHTDELGLATWKPGDPDFAINFDERLTQIGKHCPTIEQFLRTLFETDIEKPLREIERILQAKYLVRKL